MDTSDFAIQFLVRERLEWARAEAQRRASIPARPPLRLRLGVQEHLEAARVDVIDAGEVERDRRWVGPQRLQDPVEQRRRAALELARHAQRHVPVGAPLELDCQAFRAHCSPPYSTVTRM